MSQGRAGHRRLISLSGMPGGMSWLTEPPRHRGGSVVYGPGHRRRAMLNKNWRFSTMNPCLSVRLPWKFPQAAQPSDRGSVSRSTFGLRAGCDPLRRILPCGAAASRRLAVPRLRLRRAVSIRGRIHFRLNRPGSVRESLAGFAIVSGIPSTDRLHVGRACMRRQSA